MHYRNGREAKNGDIVISLDGYGDKTINAIGVLYSAAPGNDYCNGSIAPIQPTNKGACLIDCLHIEDVLAILSEKGLGKRSESNLVIETKTYTDGSSATGVAPLPDLSPEQQVARDKVAS